MFTKIFISCVIDSNVTDTSLIKENGSHYRGSAIQPFKDREVCQLREPNCKNNALLVDEKEIFKHETPLEYYGVNDKYTDIATLKQKHYEDVKALNQKIIQLNSEKIKLMNENINYLSKLKKTEQLLHEIKHEIKIENERLKQQLLDSKEDIENDNDNENDDNMKKYGNNIDELDDELCQKLKKTEQILPEIKIENERLKQKLLDSKEHIEDDTDNDDDDNMRKCGTNIDELLDDELCQKLQDDLENYMVDQKKRKKHPLKELKIFHENRSQIVRNWDNLLYRNYFKSLWEVLVDKLEEQYDDENDDDVDAEKTAYNILFDIVIECYDILHTEYTKIKQNDYMNPNVIDMVLMNINTFYDLMRKNKLKGRIVNIYEYINNKIEEIYGIIKQNHAKYIDNIDKDQLYEFVVNCCEIIWSVLHYDFKIYPLQFLVNGFDIKYDDKIHENDGDCHGDNIKHYVFPSLKKKDNKYKTKIWVICKSN